ncbi:hypothetical protein QBC45DRAFT_421332 [Copromyces sp. CBS 386.78]|nr:hypothetical protein QBC45DRAFT_421332 [Copromyces sp. CBS 386.78]
MQRSFFFFFCFFFFLVYVRMCACQAGRRELLPIVAEVVVGVWCLDSEAVGDGWEVAICENGVNTWPSLGGVLLGMARGYDD